MKSSHGILEFRSSLANVSVRLACLAGHAALGSNTCSVPRWGDHGGGKCFERLQQKRENGSTAKEKKAGGRQKMTQSYRVMHRKDDRSHPVAFSSSREEDVSVVNSKFAPQTFCLETRGSRKLWLLQTLDGVMRTRRSGFARPSPQNKCARLPLGEP